MTRPELELVVHVPGQLELEPAGPCALCRRATDTWADLCDACAAVFQHLADALGARS